MLIMSLRYQVSYHSTHSTEDASSPQDAHLVSSEQAHPPSQAVSLEKAAFVVR
jgi:hypothetical protein